MEFVTGYHEETDIQPEELECYVGQKVMLHGAVHALRDMGEIVFLELRCRTALAQCVTDNRSLLAEITEECCVRVTGTVHADSRAPGGFELTLETVKLLSRPAEPLPVAVNKWKMNLNVDTHMNLRPVTLRNLRERSIFRIQAGICRGFREYLDSEGFTEIHTPKIQSRGAEGGSNIFRLEYFSRRAYLAQSPQFYKQTMAGVFERVYEVAPVFRAEKHSTVRHLNEYTSLDFEMAYIDSFRDVMQMESAMLRHVFAVLRSDYSEDLQRLGAEAPDFDRIPEVRFDEAKRLASEKYGRPIRNPYDLEPEEEINIGRYFKEEYGSDFVFVTHYPSKKRPFYAMDDPEDPRFTLSFDLLYKGMEITTGGQRVHDYEMLVKKMAARDMDPEDIHSYMMIFRHGMPPHGGLGIGLERLTMRLLNLENVRYATLFPRDMSRLEP